MVRASVGMIHLFSHGHPKHAGPSPALFHLLLRLVVEATMHSRAVVVRLPAALGKPADGGLISGLRP